VPTLAQIRELFGALADEPDFAVFLRLSTTAGLRPSEICALRWLDVDLDAATVSINGSVVTAKSLPQKYARKDDPKSVHSERLLALDAATVELLRAHRGRCEHLAVQLDGRLDRQAYVFARIPDGRTPWRPDTVSKWFTALVRRLGHDYTPYGLRHSWRPSSAPSPRPARCESGWDTAASQSRAATCTGSARPTAPQPSTWALCLIGTDEAPASLGRTAPRRWLTHSILQQGAAR
jgi:integrase